MRRRIRVAVSLVSFSVAIGLASSPSAHAAKGSTSSYNCRSDKQLDVPIQFTATLESAGRVHVSMYGGSDKSNWVQPFQYDAWSVYDSAGRDITAFTDYLVTSYQDRLKDTYLEGLLPGSYTIELTSMDLCGNKGYSRQSVTMPVPTNDTIPPVVSTPTLVQIGALWSYKYVLYFSVTDNTAIRHISVYVNGSLLQEYAYFDDVSFRWWHAMYPADGVLTPGEGPTFQQAYPTNYAGQSAFVEIVVEDLAGNRSTASAQLVLP